MESLTHCSRMDAILKMMCPCCPLPIYGKQRPRGVRSSPIESEEWLPSLHNMYYIKTLPFTMNSIKNGNYEHRNTKVKYEYTTQPIF